MPKRLFPEERAAPHPAILTQMNWRAASSANHNAVTILTCSALALLECYAEVIAVDAPLRSVELTQVTEWEDGQIRSSSDDLAAEEPLQILACSELTRELKIKKRSKT